MPGVALWCQPLAISIGVRSVENFLSYAGKPASELACWTARDSAVLVIGAKIKRNHRNVVSTFAKEFSSVCRTLQLGACDAKSPGIVDGWAVGGCQSAQRTNAVRRRIHWHGRARAHVPGSDGSLRDDATQSRYLEWRLGSLFRISPRRHFDYGL
jgi:hypothetical protein